MKIHLLAVGTRMPRWVELGYQEYADRMPPQCQINLIEIPAARRSRSADLAVLARAEADDISRRLLKVRPVIALDRSGTMHGSEDVARAMSGWLATGAEPAFVIGGPEGLTRAFLGQAHEVWSLSALTFPHGIVRVMVAEQLYRAWSILNHLPYHRGLPA